MANKKKARKKKKSPKKAPITKEVSKATADLSKGVLKKEKYAKYTSAKYPALNFNRQVANRKEYLDIDYIDKLNDEEKEWMNSFLSETVITNFKHRGDKIYNTKEERKEFYDDNNRRNRCMLSKAKATGMVVSYSNDDKGIKYFNSLLDEAHAFREAKEGVEDAIIALIDLKNSKDILDGSED